MDSRIFRSGSGGGVLSRVSFGICDGASGFVRADCWVGRIGDWIEFGFGALGAARCRSGHPVSDQSDSRCLVETGPGSAIVAPLRRAAGHFAVDLATYHFLPLTLVGCGIWTYGDDRVSRIVAVSIEGRDIS